jgi:hypothetical protein
MISPERMGRAGGHRPANWPNDEVTLEQAINSDWPLRCVYRAYWMFWARL